MCECSVRGAAGETVDVSSLFMNLPVIRPQFHSRPPQCPVCPSPETRRAPPSTRAPFDPALFLQLAGF